MPRPHRPPWRALSGACSPTSTPSPAPIPIASTSPRPPDGTPPFPRQPGSADDTHDTIDIRHASHPEAARAYDTAGPAPALPRAGSLPPRGLSLTYSHHERFVIGGAMPTEGRSPFRPQAPGHGLLPGASRTRSVQRRRARPCECGCPDLRPRPARRSLCRPRRRGGVVRERRSRRSREVHLLSTPAHAECETVLVPLAKAKTMALGEQSTGNRRTIHQMIHPPCAALASS